MTIPDDQDQLSGLQRECEAALDALIQRVLSETAYQPTGFMQMVKEHGGVRTVRILLAGDRTGTELHPGLQRLWKLGRLDLSIERFVAYEPRWVPLFSEDMRSRARSRLEALEYRE